jgi:hypothetical protein
MVVEIKKSASVVENLQKQHLMSQFVNWSIINDVERQHYIDKVENILLGIDIYDRIDCNVDHRQRIDVVYELIIDALKEGTKKYIICKTKKFQPVPGWNKYCRKFYENGRFALNEWLRSGRIRYGVEFNLMKDKIK